MSTLKKYLEKISALPETCDECDWYGRESISPYPDDPDRPVCEKAERWIDDWSHSPERPDWCPLVKK